MIKAPSLVSEYTLIYSGDPALSLPDDADERARVLRVARETGKWDELLTGNEAPTLFHFRNLTRTEWAWLTGEMGHSTEHGRSLSAVEANDLAIRLALRNVENFGAHKVERKRYRGDIWLASTKIIDAIYAEAGKYGEDILGEFGSHVIERARQQLGPL